jgi:hypothetical protein
MCADEVGEVVINATKLCVRHRLVTIQPIWVLMLATHAAHLQEQSALL